MSPYVVKVALRGSRFFEHLRSQLIMITVTDDDTADPGINDHFGANDTGVIRAIQRRSFRADAVQRCLNNRILLPRAVRGIIRDVRRKEPSTVPEDSRYRDSAEAWRERRCIRWPEFGCPEPARPLPISGNRCCAWKQGRQYPEYNCPSPVVFFSSPAKRLLTILFPS